MILWMLPGAIWHYSIYNAIFDSIYPSVFYDGVNCCAWNGGRSNVAGNDWNDSIAESYYRFGHSIALTFSNDLISLNNATGNMLLEKLSSHNGNCVILRNRSLAEYIRKKYNNISIIYSITGTPETYSRSFYDEVLEYSDFVVPRWHHVSHIINDFQENIQKFEIMVNHTCPSDCPLWNEHYDIVNRSNRNDRMHDSYDSDEITCLIDEKLTDLRALEKDIFRRTFDMLKSGFSRFKLAGREFSRERMCRELNTIMDFLKKGTV